MGSPGLKKSARAISTSKVNMCIWPPLQGECVRIYRLVEGDVVIVGARKVETKSIK